MSENEAVGSVTAVLKMESSSYSAAQRKLLAENAALRKSMKDLGASVDSVSRSSGKILSISSNVRSLGNASEEAAGKAMKLQNNIGLIDNVIRGQATKAIADLMRKMSGVGVVMDALPILGLAAGLVLVARVAAEAAEKFEKVRNAAESINTAYRPMLDKLRESNDVMSRSNELIREHIERLEEQPVNNLARSLADARVEADKLGDSLFADLQRVQKLLNNKDNHVGFLWSEITGEESTNDIGGSILSYQKQMDAAGQKIIIDTHNGSPQDAVAADKKALADKRKSYMDYLYTQLAIADPASLTYAPAGSVDMKKFRRATMYPTQQDSGGVASILRNELAYQSMAAQTPGLSATHDALKRQLDTLERGKKGSDSSKTYDQSGWYAQQTRRYQSYQNDLATHRESTSELGSRMTLRNATALAARNAKILEASNLYGSAQDRANLGRVHNMQEQETAKARRDLSSGTINAHQFSLEQIRINGDAFAAQLKMLTEKLAEAKSDLPADTPETKAARYKALAQASQIQTQIDNLKSQMSIQKANLQLRAIQTSPQGAAAQGAVDYFNRYDTANIAKTVTGGTLNTVNNSMARLISTGHGNFAGMFRQLSGMGAHEALGGIEKKFLSGPLEKLLGGKGTLGATAATAMWVQNVDKAAASAAALPGSGMTTRVSTLLDKIPMVSKISGFLDKLTTRAGGGPLSAGQPSLVGEQGPELFLPGQDGYVMPATMTRAIAKTNPATQGIAGLMNKISKLAPKMGAGFATGGPSGAVLDAAQSFIPGAENYPLKSMLAGITLPHFAAGGSISGDMPSIVGENGPELFMPRTSGTIVPNHALGGGDTHYNIDARGATDPAATAIAVQRAIRASHDSAMRGAVRAQHEMKARTPKG